ncbi:MAG: hypothetical protein E6I96_12040 [Chloroflexi bacterium]|nr:MAG: hypothetical protein E6I96_12040 [Chloroflexota bacterium]
MIDQLDRDDPLGTEMVMLALTAWPYFPHLVSDYLGPYEWLRTARMNPVDRHSLLSRALRLAEAADRGGDAYVALQTRAIATQIEIDAEPDRFTYLQLVERLLSCRFVLPDPDEVASLARDVDVLVANVSSSGSDAVTRWETAATITGEAKWDAALDAYRDGRRYARERFPVAFEERLDIGRTSDPITSLHLTWREPEQMVFEVNVAIPRTRPTIRYEVAHNIYPGDYLHMAVLTQRTFGKEGRVAACIKLKNAPENVIAEGIEEVAPFRLDEKGEPRQAAIDHLRRMGHMSAERASQELDRIEHPLWGTYQYSYWLGRHLVAEADALAGSAATGAEYLGWLYGGLHVPETFLDDARRILDRSLVT